MSDFTASNGVVIRKVSDMLTLPMGRFASVPLGIDAPTIAGDVVAALREFFQKENDGRLGRWRDPEQPEHVVYELFASTISVWSERYGTGRIYHREDPSETGSYLDRSAIAYFSTHAESKPWHEAKPAEGWLLTIDGEIVVAVRGADEDFIHAKGVTPWSSQAITAGRRVWPEVAS